jgi:hypothetical protein
MSFLEPSVIGVLRVRPVVPRITNPWRTLPSNKSPLPAQTAIVGTERQLGVKVMIDVFTQRTVAQAVVRVSFTKHYRPITECS